MDRLVYLGMAGAKQALEQQAVIAHNMANAGTPGFRAQLNHFRAVPVVGGELTTRAQVVASTPGADLRPGPVQVTGRALDVAIDGPGWLAVRLADGSTGYTRNGSLQFDAEGQLRVGGAAVLGEAGPLAVSPDAQPSVAADGTVSDGAEVAGRLRLVDLAPTALQRGEDGFFRLNPGLAEPPMSQQVRVRGGALEGSNVQPAQVLVEMIANARMFELQMKTVQTADQNAQQANKLLALG